MNQNQHETVKMTEGVTDNNEDFDDEGGVDTATYEFTTYKSINIKIEIDDNLWLKGSLKCVTEIHPSEAEALTTALLNTAVDLIDRRNNGNAQTEQYNCNELGAYRE